MALTITGDLITSDRTAHTALALASVPPGKTAGQEPAVGQPGREAARS